MAAVTDRSRQFNHCGAMQNKICDQNNEQQTKWAAN